MSLSVRCTGPRWEPRGFTGDETRSVPVCHLSQVIHTPSIQSVLQGLLIPESPEVDGAQTGEADRRCLGKRGGLLGGCLTTASATERFAGTKFRLIAVEREGRGDKGGRGRCEERAAGAELQNGMDEETRGFLKV